MSDDLKILCIDEKPMESIKRDGFSLLCALALVLPGVWLESAAMQWLGVALFFLVICTVAVGVRKKHTKTITEARAYLDDLEASQ